MYSMVQTQSGTPYAGAKGMLRTIFGLDHLGDDALAVKQALMKVSASSVSEPRVVDALSAIPSGVHVLLGYNKVSVRMEEYRPRLEE